MEPDAAQRLKAAEAMLVLYGQENERLAAINEALVSSSAFVDSDYTSGAPEISLGFVWRLPKA